MDFGFFLYRKKFEIATDEEGTPIKQDTKKGKLREVSGPCQLELSSLGILMLQALLIQNGIFSCIHYSNYYSSKRVISSSTMDVSHRHGKTPPSFIPMQTAAEVTMILWMFVRLEPGSFLVV